MNTRNFTYCIAISAMMLIGFGSGSAKAQQEGLDILWDVDASNNVIIRPQEAATDPSHLFNRTLNLFNGEYVHDLGFDVAPGIDAGLDYNGKKIKSLRIQQVGISPELTGVYQFDGVTPVWGQGANFKKSFLQSDTYIGGGDAFRLYADDYNDPSNLVDPNDPTQGYLIQPAYYHQHFDMQTTALGAFYFDFQATEVTLNDGTLVPNSQVFRINFTNVPEPGTWALLFGAAITSAGFLRRRK